MLHIHSRHCLDVGRDCLQQVALVSPQWDHAIADKKKQKTSKCFEALPLTQQHGLKFTLTIAVAEFMFMYNPPKI